MINNKSILAIIPARGGSKGIPRKNIKLLNGKPLISYTIEEALKSKYIDRVIVSTDNEEIANISKSYGAECPFLRPIELAQDDSTTMDTILYNINELKEKFDYICLLQCTSPLRNAEDINKTIERVIETDSDSIISVCESQDNPYWTTVIEQEKLKFLLINGEKIKRRQELPTTYKVNGSIYLMKTHILMSEKKLFTDNTVAYIMSQEHSVDIDTLLDFKFAEVLIRERNDNNA
ncbi:cytidylyltransferase domain-containing protein [Clostridium vincentii]|uniref:CMP-N,N'-diacetyllegionaminic acid synthase n=1 Tax=Clostridium vincentii TaxID=52704 RepID=A0A2T0BG13_9CLOT|nr:acylneuraminate cytidylyltransferase family protein [Clostridium vincentii]PRR82846.1 CMP-N,N'-diacetyllegionaminic acid synthase [Clostridium vincentii]